MTVQECVVDAQETATILKLVGKATTNGSKGELSQYVLASSDGLLEAYNGQYGVRARSALTLDALIPERLTTLLANLSNDVKLHLEMEAEWGELSVSAGGHRSKMGVLNPVGFDVAVSWALRHAGDEVPTPVGLVAALKFCMKIPSGADGKYSHTPGTPVSGIYLSKGDVVALSSFRGLWVKLEDFPHIGSIPPPAVSWLTGFGNPSTMRVFDGGVLFGYDEDVLVLCRTIPGEYEPAWRGFLPVDCETMPVRADSFRSALDRVVKFSRRSDFKAWAEFRGGGSELTIKLEEDNSAIVEKVSGEGFPAISFRTSPAYVLDALSVCGRVGLVEVSGKGLDIVFLSEDRSYRYVMGGYKLEQEEVK